jgi:hypothetical protein
MPRVGAMEGCRTGEIRRPARMPHRRELSRSKDAAFPRMATGRAGVTRAAEVIPSPSGRARRGRARRARGWRARGWRARGWHARHQGCRTAAARTQGGNVAIRHRGQVIRGSRARIHAVGPWDSKSTPIGGNCRRKSSPHDSCAPTGRPAGASGCVSRNRLPAAPISEMVGAGASSAPGYRARLLPESIGERRRDRAGPGAERSADPANEQRPIGRARRPGSGRPRQARSGKAGRASRIPRPSKTGSRGPARPDRGPASPDRARPSKPGSRPSSPERARPIGSARGRCRRGGR